MKKTLLLIITIGSAYAGFSMANSNAAAKQDSTKNEGFGTINSRGMYNAPEPTTTPTDNGAKNNAGTSGNSGSSAKAASDTSKGMMWEAGSYRFKKGMVMQKVNGMKSGITNTVTLSNGTTISPTGLVKTKAGKTTQLKNGDWIDKDGVITNRKDTMNGMED